MVGVVPDEGEVVAALARPLVQAALHVGSAADFEHERWGSGGSGGGWWSEWADDVAGAAAGDGGWGEERGGGVWGWGERGVGGEPEHVDVAWLGGRGEGFGELGEEEGCCLGRESGGDEREESVGLGTR